jgi:hypothetical protein
MGIPDKLDLVGNAKNVLLSPLNLAQRINENENEQPRLLGMKSLPIQINYQDRLDNQSGSELQLSSPSHSYKN